MTPDPEPCAFVGCSRFEPDEMVSRKLTKSGIDDVFWYCSEHDPLDDAAVTPYFEEVAEDA